MMANVMLKELCTLVNLTFLGQTYGSLNEVLNLQSNYDILDKCQNRFCRRKLSQICVFWCPWVGVIWLVRYSCTCKVPYQ